MICRWLGYFDLRSKIKMVDIIKYSNPDLVIAHYSKNYQIRHINVYRIVFDSVYLVIIKI
jgi:LmbE family N-acetylglucosaminyl deacetylase